MINNKIIFFDLETNGIDKKSSVLSIAALKYIFNGKSFNQIEDPFIRYYYRRPSENWNIEAQKVNGLTDDIINKKRGNCEYELFFYRDQDSFKEYCAGINLYVGHNIKFDEEFLNFTLKNTFCTMLNNEKIVQAKNGNGKIKWPSLEETALYYKIDMQSNKLHDSFYDISLTFKIFEKMFFNELTKNIVLEFIGK